MAARPPSTRPLIDTGGGGVEVAVGAAVALAVGVADAVAVEDDVGIGVADGLKVGVPATLMAGDPLLPPPLLHPASTKETTQQHASRSEKTRFLLRLFTARIRHVRYASLDRPLSE
jgi:hypothetical protein